MALHTQRADASAATLGYAPVGSILGTLSESHPVPASKIKLPGFLAWAAVLLVFIAFNYYAMAHLHALDSRVADSTAGRENGLLEITQLIALIPALALFWFAGLKGFGAVRIAGALLAMIAAIVLVREVDFRDLNGVGSWFSWLWDHGVQDGLQIIFGLAAVLYLLLKRQYFLKLFRLGFRWQAWPCIASVLLLVIAQFFIEVLPYDTGGPFWAFRFWEFRFLEELVEANGYFLLVLASWQHLRLVGDPELDSPVEASG